MPILDPSLVLQLLGNKDKLDHQNNSFFISCLQTAAKKFTPTLESIEIMLNMKTHLKSESMWTECSSYLGLQSKIDDEVQDDFNFYEKLYDSLSEQSKVKQTRFGSIGYYYSYGSKLRFFRPSIKYEFRSWYFTYTKNAILCMNVDDVDDDKKYSKEIEHFDSIYAEHDLIAACGYSISIVILARSNSINNYERLMKLLTSYKFAEIHYVSEIEEKKNSVSSYGECIDLISQNLDNFEGYFYWYSQFFNDKSLNDKMKQLKLKPYFQCFLFSMPVLSAIKDDIKLKRTNKFIYAHNGFDTDLIFVQLQNIPLYASHDAEADPSPIRSSGFTTAYMTYNDFQKWNRQRSKLFYDDQEGNNDFIVQYADFDDLHSIKIEVYVKETLFLTKTGKDTLRSVDTILKSQMDKLDDNETFKKETFCRTKFFSLFKEEKIRKMLSYVGYAYSMHEFVKNDQFSMHKNQIFTALEVCNRFLNINQNEDETHGGTIYQLETGEGKSCIICLIASLLALNNKTVHIVSTNIALANRDYHESYTFFKNLGLKTAVLLHFNELPGNVQAKISEKYSKKNADDITIKPKDTYDADINSSKEQFNLEETATEENTENTENNIANDDQTESQNENNIQEPIENQEGNKNSDGNETPKPEEEMHDGSKEFSYNANYFPSNFFDKKLFHNSSNMNFSVCGVDDNGLPTVINKANIVFSTFVNYECLYLKLMETCPSRAIEFFGDCFLIIDEADSILIDELTNGTILSRSLKTNGSEVLPFIYDQYMAGIQPDTVLAAVKEKFPKCSDLELHHIKDMFQQIKMVQDQTFRGKYSIETKAVKEKLSMKSIVEKSKLFIKNVDDALADNLKVTAQKLKGKFKSSNDKDADESNSPNMSADKKLKKKKKKQSDENYKAYMKQKKRLKDENTPDSDDKNIFVKSFGRKIDIIQEVIPFDNQKGVLEPNKEFTGFVQQFIAIKEMRDDPKKNAHLLVKDISMNYLYVSHPIFVSLYQNVCGLTGTVGGRYDKQLLQEQYKLTTRKIPRNNPNLRIQLPTLLCESLEERNHKITSEVIEFNKRDNPVLVIVQDLEEIAGLYQSLHSRGIQNINIFDGKNEKLKPDLIAGNKGAVSLGTNVCGRGTDIKNPYKPLHVIVAYYTSNSRVMNQAYGRTARQGQEGTVRIICLQSQYLSPIYILNSAEAEGALGDFRVQNRFQIEFINKIKSKREWIFNGKIDIQKFEDNDVRALKKTKINVNRIVAYNFEFPVCMSIPTFLRIQAQKIFSLYNCPNCKYTWILFQKYVREMVLESWSLFIEQTQKSYYATPNTLTFEKYLKQKIPRLYEYLWRYLPEDNDLEIVPTFMHIFNIVKGEFTDKINNVFPEILATKYKAFSNNRFVSFNFGFRPFSLINESGARINEINGDDDLPQTFIFDPELKYLRTHSHHKFSILSITEKIDDLFNFICKTINDILGSKIGLKFFLKRTLVGCEFGVSFDFNIINEDALILQDLNCLVDKDPLLLFTITVKSMIPVLAGILIIVVIYVASLSKSISEWIGAFSIKFAKELGKKVVKKVAEIFAGEALEKALQPLIAFLIKKVTKQIDQLGDIRIEDSLKKTKKQKKEKSKRKGKIKNIFKLLLQIVEIKEFEKAGDHIKEIFTSKASKMCKIGFSSKFAQKLADGFPYSSFLKIGLLLLMLLASFIIGFNIHPQSIEYNNDKEAKAFDKNQDTQAVLIKHDHLIDQFQKSDKIEVTLPK